jgi:nucleoside-diphosphate-sugar epimerase
MNEIDLFGGTGFIGSNFKKLYTDTHVHERNNVNPIYDNVLYMISTTDNYNVFTNLFIDVDTNLTHLLRVLDCYRTNENKRKDVVFNFVSSWFVYGKIDELPAKETTQCNPRGFYSITKKCAEDLIISFCETYKMKYRILRLANVYGPNDNDVSKKKNALQYLIDKISKGDSIDLYHNGDFIRDYIHVSDVCKAIKLCIEKSDTNSIINIGSGVPYKFRSLIDYVVKLTSSNSKIVNVEPTEFHKIVQIKDMYLDTSKLKNYGFECSVNIFDGIKGLLLPKN